MTRHTLPALLLALTCAVPVCAQTVNPEITLPRAFAIAHAVLHDNAAALYTLVPPMKH